MRRWCWNLSSFGGQCQDYGRHLKPVWGHLQIRHTPPLYSPPFLHLHVAVHTLKKEVGVSNSSKETAF